MLPAIDGVTLREAARLALTDREALRRKMRRVANEGQFIGMI